ncbi:MAG: DUF4386 domain-containing protein [Acidobacteriota bacterium]|nr:DUF4386 domain-containing protein [Acidobacteriota bacterium]
MNARRKTARIAGVLYLLMAITGAFSIMYIPSTFIVPGDAAATAGRIQASETLYRAGIASDLVTQLLFIALVLILYQLLESVDRRVASLMVILVLVSVPMAMINTLNLAAPLILSSNAAFLSAFAKPQLDALSLTFLNLRGHGVSTVSIFWGLWLFPFGLLVYRSRFIPRILGVFLMAGCFAYLIDSFTALLLPAYAPTVSQFTVIPLAIGEFAMIFWLLIRGVRETPGR